MKARIVTTHGKLVYVVFGSIGVSLLSVTALTLVGGAAGAGAVFSVLAFWAWIVIGARLFRGADEPVDPPRSWWRLTAAPKAGFVLAGVAALQVLGTAVTTWATGLASPSASSSGDPNSYSGAAAVTAAVAGVAYLHSSLRLRAGQR